MGRMMKSEAEVFQVAGGRWNWYDIELGDCTHPGRIDIGLVTFASAAEAEEDLHQHRVAGVTAAGRVVLPRHHLETLALAAFEQYQQCVGAKARPGKPRRRPVRAQATDEHGTGWDFALQPKPPCDDCLGQLHSVVVAMRQRYAFDDASWILLAAQPVLPLKDVAPLQIRPSNGITSTASPVATSP